VSSGKCCHASCTLIANPSGSLHHSQSLHCIENMAITNNLLVVSSNVMIISELQNWRLMDKLSY
jgi:hypothetical protein